jgi:hypothetical protein
MTSREVGVLICLLFLAVAGRRVVLSGWVATARSDASISWISRSIRQACDVNEGRLQILNKRTGKR